MQLNLVPNNIGRFAKMNHVHFMANALERKDVLEFCRHFFCYTMDCNGLAEFAEPVTVVIAGLTNWATPSIRKALHRMAMDGELVRPNENDKVVVMNDTLVNKQGMAKPGIMRYELQGGREARYTARQHELIARLKEFARLNEERIMSVINENERLQAEVMRLQLEIAELKGQLRGFTLGMDKAIEKTLGQCLDSIKGQGSQESDTTNPPVLSLVRYKGEMRLDGGKK